MTIVEIWRVGFTSELILSEILNGLKGLADRLLSITLL